MELEETFQELSFGMLVDKTWRGTSKSDENGCVGCFWYDPYKWRRRIK
jgi:hypothetical protein